MPSMSEVAASEETALTRSIYDERDSYVGKITCTVNDIDTATDCNSSVIFEIYDEHNRGPIYFATNEVDGLMDALEIFRNDVELLVEEKRAAKNSPAPAEPILAILTRSFRGNKDGSDVEVDGVDIGYVEPGRMTGRDAWFALSMQPYGNIWLPTQSEAVRWLIDQHTKASV